MDADRLLGWNQRVLTTPKSAQHRRQIVQRASQVRAERVSVASRKLTVDADRLLGWNQRVLTTPKIAQPICQIVQVTCVSILPIVILRVTL